MGPGGTMDWVFGPDGPVAMAGQMGPGGPWGPGGRRRGRRERGDVRAAILLLLAEQPGTATRSSPRSPTAARAPGNRHPPDLPDLGAPGPRRPGRAPVREDHGRRVFTRTPEGESLVAAERDSWGEPWTQAAAAERRTRPLNAERAALWHEAQQLAAAVWQVAQLNQAQDIQAATAALTEARKAIYRRLAE